MRGLLVTIVREPRQKGISYCFSGHLLLKESSMLQLKGGFLRTGRRSGGWMVPVRDLVAAHSPEAAGYHQRSQPELKLPAPRASPPQNQEWDGRRGAIPLAPVLFWLCPVACARTQHPTALHSHVCCFQLSVQRIGEGKAWQSESKRPQAAGELAQASRWAWAHPCPGRG